MSRGAMAKNKSLCTIADEYLYSINPMAQRIGEDVRATKEAYEGLWNALSTAEKNQAIDETIIQPEVALKYTLSNIQACKDLPEYYPKLRIQTGMKYVVDETGTTLRWRDEHSAPFSFMTRSQMNLNLFDGPKSPLGKAGSDYGVPSSRYDSSGAETIRAQTSLDDYCSSSDRMDFYRSDSYSDGTYENSDGVHLLDRCPSAENSGGIFTKLINKTSLLKLGANGTNEDDDDGDTEILMSRKMISVGQERKREIVDRNQMSIHLNDTRPKSDINESTSLLEAPSSYSRFRSSRTDREDAIPKTGFEFLDNW